MTFKYLVALAAFGSLAACGGSGGGDDDTGGEGVLTTNGVLTEVEVPSSADLESLPTDVQDLVNAFVDANESASITSTRPTGSAGFTGEYGFGFDDADNATVVIGDMSMSVDFDNGTISGTVSNLVGDDEGTTLNIGNDLTISAVIDNVADIAGTVSGNVDLEGESYGFEASIAGAFAGDNADTALGTTMGLVTNPDNSSDSISGYFLGNKQ